MRLTYNEIAARLGLSALESDIALTATVTDSREAAPGALFVCIPGSRVDGHDFVPAAVELGASAVLASRALPGAGVPVLVVEDTIKALGSIAAMVLQYGGIREGDNSLAVSIAKVERNLRKTPWVEEVSVKRLLPDRFVIRLKERLPSFWVHKDGVLYYANELGEIIAPVESKNFLSLPTLRVDPGAEDALPYLTRLMKGMQSGLLPIEAGAVSSVSVSPGKGIEIYLEDREMRLSIATDDWEGNLSRLSLTLGDLARRHELRNVREIRSVNGNVWVLLNQPA